MSDPVCPKQQVIDELQQCQGLLAPLVKRLRLVAAALDGGPPAPPLALDEILGVETACVAAPNRTRPHLPWVFSAWIPVSERQLRLTMTAGLAVHFDEKRAYLEQVRCDVAATTLAVASVLHELRQRPEALRCVIVHLNDTYLLEERPDRALPGFARAAATIKLLRRRVHEAIGERFLVLHSGDFLGPSRVGKHSRGSTVVQLLDKLGLDWCTLGNHEFDYGDELLRDRLGSANFKVVLGNVEPADLPLRSLVLWPEVPNAIVAMTGVVSSSVVKSFPEHWGRTEAAGTLQAFVAASASAEFRVVLSHATLVEDRSLRRELPRQRCIVLGGHDHDIDYCSDDGAPIYKNLANLQTMRVLLLFAGGRSRIQDLLSAHDALLKERCKARGVSPFGEHPPDVDTEVRPRYPEDCELVLSALPALDAKLFRKHWKAANGEFKPQANPRLLDAILSLPHQNDVESVLFRYDDHMPPEPEAAAIVEAAVRACAEDDESLVVRDQPSDPPDGFDCRDEMIRKHPTAFGVLVAECVRRQTGAQFALLNSGGFRGDCVLPRRIELRDLLDCFLYDDAAAVIVVALPRWDVMALLEHGRRCSGGGAYPQVSPAIPPDEEVLRVAISAYLLTNPKTIDGYDQTLANLSGGSVADVHAWVRGSVLARTGIVMAIKAHAQDVELSHAGSAPIERWGATAFVLLARPFLERAEHLGLRRQIWDIVGRDGPLEDPQLANHRRAIRAWVGALYEDQPRDFFERLTAIIDDLEVHRDWFTAGIPYASLLDAAADGVGGWQH